MTHDDNEPLLGRPFMDELRRIATEHDADTIAVLVLAGTAERGLGLSMSSAQPEYDTLNLLWHAVFDPAEVEVRE